MPRALIALAMLASAWSCGGSPTQPPPVQIPQLTVTCPAAIEAQSLDGGPVSVSFSSPTTGGGQAPVTLSCTPVSGSLFGGGTTRVTCTATDARSITATCSTNVFVRVPPRLVAAGRFVSFGDSITAGVFSPQSVSVVESPFAYTIILDRLLKDRYRLQTPIVINEGISGEQAHVGGVARIRGVLQQQRPDILLLMEGANDLLAPQGVERGIEGLRAIIREAKAQNVRIAIATIPPQRSGGRRPFGIPETVPVFNVRVRLLAAEENVTLVDVYQAMQSDLSLIGVDDLHPTPRGFEVIAQTFFDAIKAGFEVPQPAIGSLR